MLNRENQLIFRPWLQKEFTERCRKNARFSMRAFARLLEMEPSSVSQILSGKRNASFKVISKICERLSIAPQVRYQLLDGARVPANEPPIQARQLAVDAFAVIADWYHFAILELTRARGFKNSPAWIARKLGISATEATIAIERLKRLELLKDENGRLSKTNQFITNYSEGETAPALKEFQRQILLKALYAIDHTPQSEKDITSITMAIDPKKIPAAKERIKKFRRELCAFLEAGAATRVYNLALQLYPISEFTVSDEVENE